MTLWLEI